MMSGMLKITLVKSMIGRPEKHRKVLRGMGLTKLNRTVELKNTPSVREEWSKRYPTCGCRGEIIHETQRFGT